MFHSPLPWKIESVNQFERSVRDAANHNVQMMRGGIFDLSELNAEFMVEAVNSYEANQAEIEQLKAKLELCRESFIECRVCRLIASDVEKIATEALEAIEKNDIGESLLQSEGKEMEVKGTRLIMFDEKSWELNESLWQEAYNKAKEEVKDMPVTIAVNRKGFRGEKPMVFMEVQVKGNKTIIDKLKFMGWHANRRMNELGRLILELQKTY